MKRLKKSFSGTFFWSYVLWIFNGIIFVLLAVKLSDVFAYILACLYVGVLPCLILSQVFLHKTRIDLFKLFAYIALGTLALYILGGLILEIVYTGQGKPANYAWVMVSLGIVIGGLVGWRFYVKLKELLNSEDYKEYLDLENYKKELAEKEAQEQAEKNNEEQKEESGK